MNKRIRVLVAEDFLEAREVIIKQINKISEYEVEIEECESYSKALDRINQSSLDPDPYHFLFIDIDFTGDDKGGKRDSGFELIEKAFNVCPISKIATYSAQFKSADLEPKHHEMVRNGLVVRTFDKDHRTENPTEWFSLGFRELIKEHFEDIWLWDIWRNHEKIKSVIKNISLSDDQSQNLTKQYEIITNLDSIILLLLRRKIFNADVVLYRLVLQLYHRCFEIYITGDKDEETIVEESENNKDKVFEYVKDLIRDSQLEFKDKKSYLRKLAAFTNDKKYRFGHILNQYRNGSVHPDKKFVPELSNIIYANITLSLFAIGKTNKISYELIKSSFDNKAFDDKGKKDLSEILNFIQNEL